MVESSDDAIITKNLDSIITSWNPAAERMFGYTEAEAIGRSIRMLIPAELQDEEDTVLAKIRAGEIVDHYETVRQRKDGTAALDFVDRVADPRRRRATSSAPRRSPATSPSGRVCWPPRGNRRRSQQKLSEVGAVVASTLDRDAIVQKVTDTATELTSAEFGAFFYNVRDAAVRRRLHAVHAVGRAEGSVRGFSAAARDGRCSARRFAARGRSGWTT